MSFSKLLLVLLIITINIIVIIIILIYNLKEKYKNQLKPFQERIKCKFLTFCLVDVKYVVYNQCHTQTYFCTIELALVPKY